MGDVMDQGYTRLLQKQKTFLASAMKRKGQIPRRRPPKQTLCQQHLSQRQSDKLQGEIGHQIITTFSPPAYLPCTKALSELRKVKVKELQLETHHRGKYLLAKCLTPPRRNSAIMAIIGDEDEECALLQLYGREHESGRPANEILKEGMVMVVKEQCFQVNSTGGYGVRTDHVSDMLWLSDSDELVPRK